MSAKATRDYEPFRSMVGHTFMVTFVGVIAQGA